LIKDTPKQTIFVELDALMDTRAGTLALMGNDALETCVTAEYFKRLNDFFKVEGFKEKYQKRDISTLKQSMVTPVLRMIKEFVKSTLLNNLNSPHVFKPEIILNIHPYTLSEQESSRFIEILASVTNMEADIRIVSMDNDELSAQYVRNHVSVMVMYHGIAWMDVQADAGRFNKRACPDVTVICPALLVKENVDMERNPFQILETITAPIIGLKFFPIEDFSMIVNPFK
jgi:hypothetical protein